MNMEVKFSFSEVPQRFFFCLESGCPKAQECFRQYASKFLADGPAAISIVNPHHAVTNGECPHFTPIRTETYAKGMKHIFDALPNAAAKAIRKELFDHFRNGRFYRYMDGTTLIDKDTQAYIKSVFMKHGVTSEPAFDSFEEHYIF